jgi:hypothetical protein
MNYEALIARLRVASANGRFNMYDSLLTEAADALERIQKMQPVAWRIPGWQWQDMRNDPPAQVDGIEFAYAVLGE